MIERDIGNWKTEIRTELFSLVNFPIIKSQLHEVDARYVANPRGTSLDVGFAQKHTLNFALAGIDALGCSNCVGVKICRDEEEVKLSCEGLKEEGFVELLQQQGSEIAVLTLPELRAWNNFYKEVEEKELIDKLGVKALALSGLRRATEQDERASSHVFESLMETTWGVFKNVGVTEVKSKGELDYAFMGDGEKPIEVPLWNVREAEMLDDASEVLVERVKSEATACIGGVLRRNGENKRNAYARAQHLAREWQPYFDNKIAVPVISPGQISLWRKMGFEENHQAVLGDKVNLKPEELMKFLYLGDSNLNSGELASMGMSLPMEGEEFGLDVVFLQKDKMGSRSYQTVDGLYGINMSSARKGSVKPKGVDNVGGILIVPDEYGEEDLQKYCKDNMLEKDLTQRWGIKINVLLVTREILEDWKINETAMIKTEEEEDVYEELNDDNNNNEIKTFGMPKTENHLTVYRGQPEIGGSKIIISGKTSGDKEMVILDWGFSFVRATSIMQRPGTALGILPFLEDGTLPMVAGLYDPEYIIKTIKEMSESRINGEQDDTVSRYLKAEIAHSIKTGLVDEEYLISRLGIDNVSSILSKENNYKDWYPEGGITLKAFMPSHAHFDHVGMAPYLDRTAPVIASRETLALLTGMSSSASSWRAKYNVISQITDYRQGRPYETFPREFHRLSDNGEIVRIGKAMSFERWHVNHSMVGAEMTGIYAGDGMIYTGDVRDGPLTDEAVEALSDKFRTIIIETTNVPEGGKSSSQYTEAGVKGTLKKIFSSPANKNRPIVLIAPTNHIERMNSVFEVAEQVGRKVALSFKHAEMVDQLRAEKNIAPPNAAGFDYQLPEIGEEVGLWVHPHTQLRAYQNSLVRKAEQGSLGNLDINRLDEEGEKWIVMLSPYVSLENQLSQGEHKKGLTVVHSSYYVYDYDAKRLAARNLRWINDQGNNSRFYADFDISSGGGRARPTARYGLHASGHMNFETMTDKVLVPLLGGPENWKGKRVVLIHGQKPIVYKTALIDRLGLNNTSDVEIIGRMKRYDPKNPLEGGFKLEI